MTKRILTVQDLSCVGQCSLTVALPILSAIGVETAVLPTSILSNHTMFAGWTKLDLDDEIDKIFVEWSKHKFTFDSLYTGYVGNSYLVNKINEVKNKITDGKVIVDPAMADHGKLYPGFDGEYVQAMSNLCQGAYAILPNLSEASLLLGIEYKEFTKQECEEIIKKLHEKFNSSVILKGVQENGKLGVMVLDKDTGKIECYLHKKISTNYHGTGDIFASVFVGMFVNGYSLLKSAKGAADFVVKCILNTIFDKEHFYGVHFEPLLKTLGKYVK